ncbi:MAG: flagellar motor switch protein FliN [Pirellulaceae bacterium]|nr:flagellar motor switch protein FliN [Pirellulaceae bacterium]
MSDPGSEAVQASQGTPQGTKSSSSESAEAHAARLLEEAENALHGIDRPAPKAIQLEELIGSGGPPEKCSLELLSDVDLDLKIELGRTHMQLEEVLKLRRGSVITLDKLAGDPVDIYANGRMVARGEVLVLNDNFCVRVAQLLGSDSLADKV